MDDLKIVGAITSAAAATGSGTITVATVTSPAAGILGAIGLTTTTTVVLPVAGVVAAAGLVGFGLYKGVSYARRYS